MDDYIVGKKVKCNQDNFYIMLESGAKYIPRGSIFKVSMKDGDTYWIRPINIPSLHVPILQIPCSDLDDFIVCRH